MERMAGKGKRGLRVHARGERERKKKERKKREQERTTQQKNKRTWAGPGKRMGQHQQRNEHSQMTFFIFYFILHVVLLLLGE